MGGVPGRTLHVGPYLSPFYSPELFGDSEHSWFGPKPAWWPGWLLFSPALLILWVPGGFRVTCYYYRGAYYKAFWADPPACAVGEPRHSYWGERRLPLVLQNVHRYFLYLSLLFLIVLASDVYKALWFKDAATGTGAFRCRGRHLGVAPQRLLAGRLRVGLPFLPAPGGRVSRPVDAGTGAAPAFTTASSCLNRRHMIWAWCSLFWVAFSDLYVRLCSMGVWSDWRIL